MPTVPATGRMDRPNGSIGWIYRDSNLVRKVHALGKPVWTTAGDAPRAELEKLIKLGVNGILSDLPAMMNSLPADMAKRRGA